MIKSHDLDKRSIGFSRGGPDQTRKIRVRTNKGIPILAPVCFNASRDEALAVADFFWFSDEQWSRIEPLLPIGLRSALDGTEIHSALSSLALFNIPNLAIQSYNLGIVDREITKLELTVLAQLNECGEASAHEVAVLGAQSRMWLVATYELMRTWRGWATEFVELHSCGALKHELDLFEDVDAEVEPRAWMLQEIKADPGIIFRLRDDLKRTHIAYTCLKYLCFALADQGQTEQPHSGGLGVNYVGINEWCGALDYKVTTRGCTLSPINRRDIAEDIQAIADGPVPTGDQLANFDDFVRGRPLSELRLRSASAPHTDQISIPGAALP